MCGLTSGLATADMTEDPVVRVCVELRVLRSIADVDKTELCRHRQSTQRKSQQIIQGVRMN